MTDPLIGVTLKGAYRIERALADGGMGVVYVAEQISLARKVVLKVLRQNFNDEDFVELFLREARINSQLNHPNVVSVFDFGRTDDGVVFLAMEHLEGHTLSDIVQAHSGLSLAKSMWVLEQICSSVHAAHKMSVVHRDIKPNNVMISTLSGDTMVAKILDFGISKPLQEKDLKYTQMGMVMGTPGYLAPEQITGQRDIDIRADIYALGALLYFMISGQPPHRGASCEIIMNKQLTKPLHPLSADQLVDSAALVVWPCLVKAMAVDRDQRYQTVGEFWQDVLNAASDHKKIGGEDGALPDAEATRYRFVYKGDIVEGVDTSVLKARIAKSMGFNAKQADTLFSGRRIIVRKNLSFAAVDKLAKQFKKVGAIGVVEEMQDATRIISRDDRANLSNSLPSIGMMESISFTDIKAAAERVESNRAEPERSSAVDSVHVATEKKANKVKRRVFAVAIALCVVCVSVGAILTSSLRYTLADVYFYKMKGLEPPRGVSTHGLRLGMSAALSGSAREIGQSMRVGINTYFNAVNEAGGVHGRQLRLVDLDDGYEPARAQQNMSQFLDTNDGVFALLGNVGTPTASAILPTILDSKTVLFGTFSGAPVLRNSPPDRYVFNYRASYAEETAALIHYFVGELDMRPQNIAVFYQNDGYGGAGLKGVEEALHQYGVRHEDIVKASYKRNTSQVTRAAQHFMANGRQIDAVVLVSTYAASAAFVNEMRERGFQGRFANVSFVGVRALAERLQEMGQSGEGILVSQVVPPYNSYATGVLRYREHLRQYFPGESPNFVSLEGYIVAEIFVEALRRAGRNLNVEALVDAIETIDAYDLGIGTTITFNLSDHQGSHRVWGTMLNAQGDYTSVELTPTEY